MAHDPPFDFSSSPCSSPNIGPVDSSSPFSSPFPSPKKPAPLMLPDAAAMTMQTPRPRRPYFTSGQDHTTPKFRPSAEESVWSGAIDFAVQEGNGFLNLAGRGLKEVSPEIIDLSKFFAISDMAGSLLQDVSSSPAAGTTTNMSNLNANTPNKRSRVTPPTPSTSSIHDNIGNSNSPGLKPARTFSRTITAGVPNHELRLDLSRNSITRLPRELFALTKLTVLLLRQNEITYLPPEIGLLTSLRELNVANNRLRYLPAEILSLRLQTLSVQPNRFLTPPDDDDDDDGPSEEGDNGGKSRDGKKRKKKYLSFSRIDSLFSPRSSQPVLGPIEYPSWQDAPRQLFPSAVELCARRLFSPSHMTTTTGAGGSDECSGGKGEPSTTKTVLEETYALPLNAVHAATPSSPSPGPWPPPIVQMFAACVPQSIARPVATAAAEAAAAATFNRSTPAEADGTEVLGIGRCPNPRHQTKRTTSMGSGVFVRHVEQRLEWRNEIAGRPVWNVPVLWRGCSSGCLDFLDEDEEEMRATTANDKVKAPTSSTGLPPFKHVVIDDNDSSSDEGLGDREDDSDSILPQATPSFTLSSRSSLSLDQDIVRPVTLPSGPLDFDE